MWPMSESSAVYAGVAVAWSAGPERVYDRLAQAIVAEFPEPEDRLVVDIGAGTGAASRALRGRGARTIGVDLAPDMVARMQARGLDAVTGDMLALPFASDHFDGAVAAFSITHVDAVASLREAARVVRGGGPILAGVFAARGADPAKQAVDETAARFGYVEPSWHARLKAELEPRSNTNARLRACAAEAGLADAVVVERVVDTGVSTPADIVAVRTGMAHLAPFVTSLAPARRRAFIDAAIAAVSADAQPLRPAVLILSSRAPA
jgi:SAM-dependent methyltransferase